MGSGTLLRVVRESIAVGIVVFWLSCRLGCGSGDDKVVVVEVVSVVLGCGSGDDKVVEKKEPSDYLNRTKI